MDEVSLHNFTFVHVTQSILYLFSLDQCWEILVVLSVWVVKINEFHQGLVSHRLIERVFNIWALAYNLREAELVLFNLLFLFECNHFLGGFFEDILVFNGDKLLRTGLCQYHADFFFVCSLLCICWFINHLWFSDWLAFNSGGVLWNCCRQILQLCFSFRIYFGCNLFLNYRLLYYLFMRLLDLNFRNKFHHTLYRSFKLSYKRIYSIYLFLLFLMSSSCSDS